MAYSFQTFSVGQVLTAAQVNQLEVNIRDHVHGTAGVSVISAATFTNEGLHILDTNASHDLIIKPGSDLTADRILSLITGDAARTITLSGNPTLNDWFDQNVKAAGSPTFVEVDAKIKDQGGGTGLKLKVISIGDWNMDSTNELDVAHGLTLANIRAVQVTVRNDANNTYSDLSLTGISGTAGGSVAVDGTNIILYRVTGQLFDNANYDSTSYNRGWITIWYTA